MYLYLDLNSFFASCEQQARPELRGKPVAVVPLMTDSTCAIAASYEAKRYGIRTGTLIKHAKEMCPDLHLVQADHKRYVEFHHQVKDAIESCVPIEKVMSIDEVVCQLTGLEAQPERAIALAKKIKEKIRQDVGECLGSSVGIAPNRLLAKIASNIQKPNGLVLLKKEELPGPMLKMQLIDITGIGRRLERRLNRFGIYDVAGLYAATPHQLKAVWGGVMGLRFHAKLHGEDIDDFAASSMRTIGHQHVLEPAKRNSSDALLVTKRLTEKAAERLRANGFYATRLSLHIKLTQQRGHVYHERHFVQSQHTGELIGYVEQMWRELSPPPPLRVGVTLSGLVQASQCQLDMFTSPKNEALLQAVDVINKRFGRGTVNFGQLPSDTARKDKIAFQRVPEVYEVN